MNEIEKAKQRVADVQAALARERELTKTKPNMRMADDTPDRANYSFWCDDCRRDFTTEAYKESHRIFGDLVITYRAECSACGSECVRLISHRDCDPYYYQSDKVNEERNKYRIDYLRHDEFGFETYYGYKFKEFDDKLKAQEERILGLERDRGFKLSRPI